MNIIKEDAENLTSVIKIQLGSEDYQPKVEKALKNVAKEVAMPGFRKGKVPMQMVKKMYGNQTLVDEINKLISDSLTNYITENKLNLLGEPLPSKEQKQIDWDNLGDIEFCFDIAQAPEVKADLSENDSFDYSKIIVDDEMVKKQFSALTQRFGKQINVDVVEDNDIIRCKAEQVDENNNVVEGGHVKENASILVSAIKDEAQKALFIGVKKEGSLVFNPKQAFNNDAEIVSLLGIDRENEVLKNASFKLTVNEIIRNQAAEVNQEFFDAAFGKDAIKSEAEACDKIKADIENRFELNSDYKLFFDVKDKLVSATNISFPEEFLKRWLISINRGNKEITEEQINSEFPAFLEDLKWQLLRNELIKNNKIEITPEDLMEAAKGFAKMQLAQFGMFNPSEEDLKRWGMEILKNKEELSRLRESEYDKAIIAAIKKVVKLNNKEVSLEEFNKMFEK